MFVPLHLFSEYSFLQSGALLNKAFSKCKEFGYQSIGITDRDFMIAYPRFNKFAEENQIKPVFGLELDIDGLLLSFFIKNEEGYKNLCIISSLNTKGEITLDEIKKKYKDGLIFVVSTRSSIFDCINNEFKNKLVELSKGIDFDDFFIGADFANIEESRREIIREFCFKYSYKLVAFPSIKFIEKDDGIILDIVNSIKNDTKLEINQKSTNNYDFFRDLTSLIGIFTQEELDESEKLANLTDFTFANKRGQMLQYSHEENFDPNECLIQKINEGLNAKNISLENNKAYKNRLNYEYKIIRDMGYSNYFLVVQDFVNYAKNHNISVGPGRGSAAGSLISYALNITEVNSLKYGLLFERFLNPERQSMPDIDTDISDNKRELVIEYLKNKYGRDKVANIIAIQKIGAKQALRDLGKVFDFPQKDINDLCNMIIEKDGKPVPLQDVYKNITNFRKIIDEDSNFRYLYEKALLIENIARQRSLGAAGYILNDIDLNGSIPLIYDENTLIVQYEKDFLEEQGFLKMDILSLTNLTTIDRTLELIKINHGIDVDLKNIDLNDPKIYNLIEKNYTMGLFQLDTAAANNSLRSFKPKNFNELAAFISLDRPATMAFVSTFANRLNGKDKITYIDPCLEKYLSETYGIMLYQEQIMQVSQEFAGFTFGQADLLRRACSKKHKSDMLAMKDKFIAGAIQRKHSKAQAEKIYDLIEKFSSYGFNKSHAVSYAMITCQTGYLKAYYPTEFYSALLESHYGFGDAKYPHYVNEILKNNVKLRLPNINKSTFEFAIDNNSLICPFTSIKGINREFIATIIQDREEFGPYDSFLNFIRRMDAIYGSKLSDSNISKLIDSGCFDELYNNRKALKQSISSAKDNATLYNQFKNSDPNFTVVFEYPNVEDDEEERLDFEFNTLGITLSNNKLSLVKNKLNIDGLTEISDLQENKQSKFICLFKNIKKIKTKDGKPMAFMTVGSEYEDAEITIFSDAFEKYGNLINDLTKNSILLITGTLRKNLKNNSLSVILDEIQKVEV